MRVQACRGCYVARRRSYCAASACRVNHLSAAYRRVTCGIFIRINRIFTTPRGRFIAAGQVRHVPRPRRLTRFSRIGERQKGKEIARKRQRERESVRERESEFTIRLRSSKLRFVRAQNLRRMLIESLTPELANCASMQMVGASS